MVFFLGFKIKFINWCFVSGFKIKVLEYSSDLKWANPS
jgi:hypothetical protein